MPSGRRAIYLSLSSLSRALSCVHLSLPVDSIRTQSKNHHKLRVIPQLGSEPPSRSRATPSLARVSSPPRPPASSYPRRSCPDPGSRPGRCRSTTPPPARVRPQVPPRSPPRLRFQSRLTKPIPVGVLLLLPACLPRLPTATTLLLLLLLMPAGREIWGGGWSGARSGKEGGRVSTGVRGS